MATSKEEYVKKQREANKAQEDADVASAIGIYDTQAQNTKASYEQSIADTEESYEDKFRLNETQRFLNTRAIERRAAEMGLTDSGMNRTQQTAVQLSYANQKGDLVKQQQKAIDTLAAAMNADLATINANKAAKEQEIRSAYADKAESEGISLYNAEQQRLADIEKARIEAEAEQTNSYYSYLTEISKNPTNVVNYEGGNLSREYKGRLANNSVRVTKNVSKDGKVTYTYTDAKTDKSSTFAQGVNPYTGMVHEDLKVNGKYDPKRAFDNGYQPRYIGNHKLQHDTGDEIEIKSLQITQNVFYYTDSNGNKKYFVWDGGNNEYVEYVQATDANGKLMLDENGKKIWKKVQ